MLICMLEVFAFLVFVIVLVSIEMLIIIYVTLVLDLLQGYVTKSAMIAANQPQYFRGNILRIRQGEQNIKYPYK